jgi:hypothetical protein
MSPIRLGARRSQRTRGPGRMRLVHTDENGEARGDRQRRDRPDRRWHARKVGDPLGDEGADGEPRRRP